jgi:hypothetical protein
MIQGVETSRHVGVEHPTAAALTITENAVDGVFGGAPWAESVAAVQKMGLEERFQNLLSGALGHPISDRQDADDALAAAWLA